MSHVPLLSFTCWTRSGRNWRVCIRITAIPHVDPARFLMNYVALFNSLFWTYLQKLIWKFDSCLPIRYGWHISLELLLSFSFFFLFPRELKGLSFLKHSPALPGMRLLFLPSILLFCGINSRALLKGRLNIGFLFNWKYKAALSFLSLNVNH